MQKSITLTIALAATFPLTGAAHAHLGHFGELAGHSHWIGIGALTAAAALTSLVLQPRKKDGDREAEPDCEAETENGETVENS
jgi:Family of unknown function (DUF6732)